MVVQRILPLICCTALASFTLPAEGQAKQGLRSLGQETSVTLSYQNAPLQQVLTQLSRRSGREVVARGEIAQRRVTIISRDRPFEDTLRMLENQLQDAVIFEPKGPDGPVEFWDKASYNAQVLPTMVRQKVFIPREITSEDAYKAIQTILTPTIGSAAFDPRSNKLIVTDLPEVLSLVQNLVEQIDVGFVTRVFYIRRNDVEEIAAKITALKSPAAPDLDVDVKTHQIIVRDRLENLRKMELLVETLDGGGMRSMRQYPLNNVGERSQGRGRKL
jgi:type II secretory pathway component GspD/PulD (secretin)